MQRKRPHEEVSDVPACHTSMQAEDTGEAMQRKRPRNVVDDDGGVGPAKQVYPLTCTYAHPSTTHTFVAQCPVIHCPSMHLPIHL